MNSDFNELYSRVDKILVKHSTFVEAYKQINMCYSNAVVGNDPTCLAIIGEPRTGKSRILEYSEQNHPRVRERNCLHVPILRVEVPSKPTPIGLIETMLSSLGDPIFDKGTENVKTKRLLKLCKTADVRLLMLDEFQHFYDRGSKKIQHHVADTLKLLVDKMRVGLVVAGLPTVVNVIESNEQLERRFMRPVMLQRFDWAITHEREEFLDILNTFQMKLHPFQFPDLANYDMGFRMYCATEGLMGFVIKILRNVTFDALDRGDLVITMEDLHRAHHEAIWRNENGLENALTPEFAIDAVKEETVNRSQEEEKMPPEVIYVPDCASEVLRT